jgi:hypothetical protein
MTWYYSARCDRCHIELTIPSGVLYRYCLPNGCELPAIGETVWCLNCDGMRTAERLPMLERLREQVRDLEDKGPDEVSVAKKGAFLKQPINVAQEFAAELWRRRSTVEWRAARQAPPRCLSCGGTQLMTLEGHGDDDPG